MDEIRAHLPEEPNSFVGRERELGRAAPVAGPDARADAVRARGHRQDPARAAARWPRRRTKFPDGAGSSSWPTWQQPDLVVSRIAAVIGITEEAGRPLLETLADALRPRRMLLALDNCEHLLDACAQVWPAPAGQRAGAAAADHQPGAAAVRGRDDLAGAAAVGAAGRRGPGGRRGRGGATRRSGCSPTGPRPPGPGSPSARTTSRPSTAICRALDGMPLAHRAGRGPGPGAVGGADRRPAGRPVRAADRGRPDGARPGSGPCAPPSSGATSCSPRPSRRCSGGCRSSPAGRWRWPSRCAPTTRSRPRSVLGLTRRAGGQVAGRARSRAARPGPVPDAGHDQGVRGAAAGPGRRGGGVPEPGSATTRSGLAEHNLALGMARIEAPWPDRVDVFRRYDVDARQRARRSLRLVPGAGRRGGGAADLRRGQPVLDRLGHVRRGRRVAALVPGAGHDRRSRPGSQGAATVVRGQLALSSDPAAAWALGTEGLKLCRERRRPSTGPRSG